ncbi:hypothetical protein DFH09DRAFT_1314839 [Mycena vulgaris]|nr:hypothetical protein DFH09DRAFT_1314839 [Mycena vulgaris]
MLEVMINNVSDQLCIYFYLSLRPGALITLANERLELVTECISPDFSPSKACDNLVCGDIDDKSLFSRCSGCKSFYYCPRNARLQPGSTEVIARRVDHINFRVSLKKSNRTSSLSSARFSAQ